MCLVEKVNLTDIRKCHRDIVELAESQEEFDGFTMTNAYRNTYKELKNKGINLYKRKDDFGRESDNLFDFIETESELTEFKILMYRNVIKDERQLLIKEQQEKNRDKREKYIERIKFIANQKVKDRKEFYSEFYRMLVLEGVNLYARRKDRNTALIEYIQNEDCDIICKIMASEKIKKMLIS